MDIDKSKQDKGKKYMFQYASKQEVYEDTGLISLQEAEELWSKYKSHIKENWDILSSPQMYIWEDCESPTDYSKVLKQIDYNDCELERGNFYKITRERVD